MLSACDLLVEPGVIADRDLRLGHELVEDQAEPAQEAAAKAMAAWATRPMPFGLACIVRRGPARGLLLRRSILHAFSLDSQPMVHAPVRKATRQGALPPHGPCNQNCTADRSKVQGVPPEPDNDLVIV